jgi:hypothetical protein
MTKRQRKSSACLHRRPADAFLSCVAATDENHHQQKKINAPAEVSARRIAFYLSDRTNAHYLGIGAPL